MTNILDILFNGAAMGAIYALIALGFVLIFKSTGLLNFAQGELCMVGAFICYNFATLLHVPYLLSFLIAIGLGAVLGTLIEVLFFRRMVGEPIYSTIIVTLGLASILTCLTGLIWGHDVYSLRSPFMDKTVAIGGMVLLSCSFIHHWSVYPAFRPLHPILQSVSVGNSLEGNGRRFGCCRADGNQR